MQWYCSTSYQELQIQSEVTGGGLSVVVLPSPNSGPLSPAASWTEILLLAFCSTLTILWQLHLHFESRFLINF